MIDRLQEKDIDQVAQIEAEIFRFHGVLKF